MQKRIYVARTDNLMTLPLCGESALCERTMLNTPPVSSRAIGRKAYAGQLEAELQRVRSCVERRIGLYGASGLEI